MTHIIISALLFLLLSFLPAIAQDPLNHLSDFNALVTNIATSALWEAVLNKDSRQVEILLINGANKNSQADPSKYTPLLFACSLDEYNTVQKLVEGNANLDIQSDGTTALIQACIIGNPNIVKLLLEANADIEIKDCINRTALNHTILACRNYKYHKSLVFDQIKSLLEAEAHRRLQVKLKTQSNLLYQSTFALAHRKRLNGFLADCLPQELINIEIAQHIAAPPYTQQEIER